MHNQEEKQKLYPTDFFQLTKSYDEILADHDLIKKMKLTLQQAGMRQYAEKCSFEELIKEAYFQCGIILRRSICKYYGDYIDLFIEREKRCFKKYDTINKRTVACMVHLLLSTRKRNPDGVAEIVDNIKNICDTRDYGFLPPNPFEKLLYSGKYKHNIDFGVRAKPLYEPIWEKAKWYDFGLDDDCNLNDIEDGWISPEDYCKRLSKSIDDVIECLALENPNDQLEALERVAKWIHDDNDCDCTDCEFYQERPNKCTCEGNPNKCTCEESWRVIEPLFFNPLKQKVIDEKRQAIMDKFAKHTKESVPSDNKETSPIRLKKGVEIAEIERIIFALCKMNYFEVVGNEAKSPDKDVFKAFGDFFGLDLSNYHNNLKLKYTSLNKQLEIFTKMEEVLQREWEKKNEQ